MTDEQKRVTYCATDKTQAELLAIIDRQQAEIERLKSPWLCDCHTWPGPDEIHAYVVAIEAKLADTQAVRESLSRLYEQSKVELEELKRTYDATVERLERELARSKEHLEAMTEYASSFAVDERQRLEHPKNQSYLDRLDADVKAAIDWLAQAKREG